MATIVTPQTSSDSSGSLIMGIVFLVILIMAFWLWGAPALKTFRGSTAPQINIPDEIDVNVNQGQQPQP